MISCGASSRSRATAEYYRGLTAFLGMLRRRPRFFRTDYFAERYEKQAHANLDRLLADIAKQGHAPR